MNPRYPTPDVEAATALVFLPGLAGHAGEFSEQTDRLGQHRGVLASTRTRSSWSVTATVVWWRWPRRPGIRTWSPA